MRVLLVANTLPPTDLSGVGEQVVQLADGLRERGVEVQVLGREKGGWRSRKGLYPIAALRSVRHAVREFRPHVVQTHESDGGLIAWWLAAIRDTLQPRPILVALLQVSYLREMSAVRRLHVPPLAQVVPSASERLFQWARAPLHIALGWLTAHSVDLVLAPSRRTLRELSADYGVADGEVLPNAMSERKASPEPIDLPAEENGLLIIGRMRVRKGIEVALAALASLPAERRPKLWLAGDGEHRDGLESAVSRLGLEESVRFLGRCSAGQVMTLLKRARALVVPSTYEGMPLVILEAMSQGTPVVATTVSGIPEVVVDGETGWLVPSEAPEDLAAALMETEDAQECERRGRAGYVRWLRYFRPQEAAAVWMNTIGKIEGEESLGEIDR